MRELTELPRRRQSAAGPLASILERERRQSASAGPPRERAQHDPVSRDETQTVDAHGEIGVPWRTPPLLVRMAQTGEITASELAAGLEFQRLFRIAELDELRAADPSRVVVSGGDSGAISARSEHARTRIREALDAVGGQDKPAALVLWYVLGLEMSMSDFEWLSQRHRRSIDRKAAKGVLIGALPVLEKFFGVS